jgi:hypothetical protein
VADAFFTPGLKNIAFGNIIWKAAGGSNIRIALIDTADYTFVATHEFRSSVVAVPAAQEETSANMTLIDAANDGILDANDVTFTGTTGDPCEAIYMYKETGAAATDINLFWWDAAAGLPVTLGGDVLVTWDNGANKIVKI